MPRGSHPTRSNDSRRIGSYPDAESLTHLTPETPGPPGLRSSDPMRFWVALRRMTARSIVAPAGAAQSTGTFTDVHSKPWSHTVHLGRCP